MSKKRKIISLAVLGVLLLASLALSLLLGKGGAVGRKLDFLVQEMNRETNTIGSKCSDTAIAGHVVEMKSELEKIREQIQNIE